MSGKSEAGLVKPDPDFPVFTLALRVPVDPEGVNAVVAQGKQLVVLEMKGGTQHVVLGKTAKEVKDLLWPPAKPNPMGLKIVGGTDAAVE